MRYILYAIILILFLSCAPCKDLYVVKVEKAEKTNQLIKCHLGTETAMVCMEKRVGFYIPCNKQNLKYKKRRVFKRRHFKLYNEL